MARKSIDLRALVATRSDEIDRMADAMRRDDGGALWTRQMRATTRGGKCMVTPAEDETEAI